MQLSCCLPQRVVWRACQLYARSAPRPYSNCTSGELTVPPCRSAELPPPHPASPAALRCSLASIRCTSPASCASTVGAI